MIYNITQICYLYVIFVTIIDKKLQSYIIYLLFEIIYEIGVIMRKKIIFLIILLLVCMIIVNSYTVEAASDFNVKVETSSTQIAKNQTTVTIYLKLGDYNADGILGYEGTLSYDKSVFESATITALNDWETPDYEPATGKFLSTTKKAKANTNIAQISLKLKSGTTAKTTKVSVSNLIISDGTKESTVNQTITYTLLANQTQENKDDTPNTNNIPTNNIVVNTNITTQTNTASNITVEPVKVDPKDKTQAATTIPQTGSGLGMVFGFIVILGIGIIAYIRYRSIPLK